jgi:5-formyltetrahydrofolate cyclo-ligase
MTKANLRKSLKLQRQKLSHAERQDHSQLIINRAFEIIDWQNIKSLHIYLPIESQNEVDTLRFLVAARQINPELKIATSWRDGVEVKTSWLDEDNKIGKLVKPSYRFSLIIIPMLGFDTRGFRLGYGGGFYDRFLLTQPSALTIGLCYEFGHLQNMPHEDHDVPLKLIATEKLIYRF